jgi:serine/threonine-protein kinase
VFEAETMMKLLMHHVQDPPLPPSRHTEILVAPELEAVLLKCLEKDPAKRPESARRLGEALRASSVEPAWDEKRAHTWWATHAPELLAEPQHAAIVSAQ